VDKTHTFNNSEVGRSRLVSVFFLQIKILKQYKFIISFQKSSLNNTTTSQEYLEYLIILLSISRSKDSYRPNIA